MRLLVLMELNEEGLPFFVAKDAIDEGEVVFTGELEVELTCLCFVDNEIERDKVIGAVKVEKVANVSEA